MFKLMHALSLPIILRRVSKHISWLSGGSGQEHEAMIRGTKAMTRGTKVMIRVIKAITLMLYVRIIPN